MSFTACSSRRSTQGSFGHDVLGKPLAGARSGSARTCVGCGPGIDVGEHPRGADHVGHPGILEAPVQVDVGSLGQGEVDGEGSSRRPARRRCSRERAQVLPGLVLAIGAGGDPAVAQRGRPAQGRRGVAAADDGHRRGRATAASGRPGTS